MTDPQYSSVNFNLKSIAKGVVRLAAANGVVNNAG
jgi:hypothetical protein